MVVLNSQGLILYSNQAGREVWNNLDLNGKSIVDLFPPEYADRYMRSIQTVLTSGQKIEHTISSLVQGKNQGFRISLQKLTINDSGIPLALFSAIPLGRTNKTIRRLQEAESEQNRLNLAANSLNAALLTIENNPAGGWFVSYANHAIDEVLGFDRETLARSLQPVMERLPEGNARKLSADLLRAAGESRPLKGEFLYDHPRKGRVWLEGDFRPVHGPDNNLVWHGYLNDITLRKAEEETLQRYQLMAANGRDIILMIDAESGQLLDANLSAEHAYGYNRSELLALNIQDLRMESTLDFTFTQMKQAAGDGIIFEGIHRRKDGSTFRVEVSSQGATINGRRTLISIIRDVTERQRLHDQLVDSEAKFSWAFESSPLLKSIIGGERGVFLDVNDTFLKKLGYRFDEVLGRTPAELNIFADPKELDRVFEKLGADGRISDFEISLRASDGCLLTGSIFAEQLELNGRILTLSMIQDITEQRRFEDALRKSETRFRAITEKSPAAVVLLDSGLKIVYATPNTENVLGYKNAERVGANGLEMIYLPDLPKIQAAMASVFMAPGASAEAEFRGNHKDGSHPWLQGTATNLLDDPDLQAIVITFTNVNERVAARQALVESENRYRAIVEGAWEGIMAVSTGDRIVRMVNEKICGMFGYTREEFIGREISTLHPEYAWPQVFSAFEEQTQKEFGIARNLPCITKDGHLFFADVANSEVQFGDEMYVIGFFSDVTEHRRDEMVREARVALSRLPGSTPSEVIMQQTLDRAEQITHSQIGFFHFIEEDQDAVWLQVWSSNTIKRMCSAEGQGNHYPVDQAGVWAESLRQGRSLIFNDYASIPGQRGLPEGHAPVIRFISVPIWRGGLIVALIGVGNKLTNYDENDILALEILANDSWDVISRQKAEKKLQESEEKYRGLVESNISAIIAVDQTGRIQFANQNAGEAFGMKASEITGKLLAEVLPVSADRLATMVQWVISSGHGMTVEIAFERNGRTNWYNTSIQPLPQAAGKPGQAILNAVDITLRKDAEYLMEERVRQRTTEIETIRQRLELAAQAAGLGIWEGSPKTNRQIWDDQAYALFGRKPGEIESTFENWLSLIHPDDRAEQALPVGEHMVGDKIQSQFRVIWPDGSIHHIRTQAVALYDENHEIERLVGIDYDITAQVQAEQILREREEMLRGANQELERAIHMKDEFLASMSHELRTPLTGILGLSEALQMETYGTLTERQRKALQVIESSGRHLLDLITDILDVSRVEAGRMDLQMDSGPLDTVCKSSIQAVKDLAQNKDQEIVYRINPPDIIIHGDLRRLKQVLVNLLSNAVKFTPQKGRLGLDVSTDAQRGEVHLTVWDEGIGIKQADLGRLFMPFVQLDSRLSRQFSGTGLGLVLVKRLVELHRGRVEVESEFGKGTRFRVSLPWNPNRPQSLAGTEDSIAAPDLPTRPAGDQPGSEIHAALPAAAEQTETAQHKDREDNPDYSTARSAHTLILVEDNEISQIMVGDFLRKQGYQVICLESAAKFFEELEKVQPAMVLMDIQLPGMDGLEAIRELRTRERSSAAQPHLAGLPVAALTALAMKGDRERCLEAGANFYMSKPLQLLELLNLIDTTLKVKAV